MRARGPLGGSTAASFRVPLYPITPLVFCAACAYLAYSSITYAQSKGAIHVSFAVMGFGLIALIVMAISSKRFQRS